MRDKQRNHPAAYPAKKARQGEIILRKPWQRVVFIVGLAGLAIVALVMQLIAIW